MAAKKNKPVIPTIDGASTFDKALNRGVELIAGQLTDYKARIYKAYIASGDESYKVTLGLKLTPGSENMIKVDTEIGFTESKVKDTASDTVQSTPLFDDLDKKKGKGK